MKRTVLWSVAIAASAALAAVEHPERYIQSRSGEIQLLPALTLEEIPRGRVSGVESAGGFVFDIEWRENKMTKMRVHSPSGGVCRIRSYAGMGSPLLRKAKGDCPNPAIAATKGAPADTLPESCFERKKNPLSSVCFDFDTEPGETLEFRGVSGNQDWTGYSSKLSDAFLVSPEAARIAQNVLDWQLDTGGWPKNVPMHDRLSPKERKAVLAMKGDRKRGTIDNGATFAEMRFLARMYKATGRPEYLDGVLRGVDFLINLQYPNGGWPQFDPSKKGYWAQITYNDGAMVNAMNLLRDVADGVAPFDLAVPDAKRVAARAAFWKGVGCILATQVKQDGKLTVWCQQHDKETLAPCQGRAFELPALTSYESLDIVRLLMSLDPADCTGDGRPDFARVEAAIEGAKDWFAKTEIRRFKFENNYRRDDGILSRRLVPVPEAEADRLWCRYYTLEDNRPFTGTRQGEKRFTFEEMERGENMSYQWFNGSGVKMEKEYAKWLKRVEKLKARAEAKRKAKTTTWVGGRGNGGVAYVQPEKDTWENPENWSNGVPASEDTVVFERDATLWAMTSEPYECGRLVLKDGATVALRSNYEANNAINPKLRPLAIEGDGTIELCRAGLETRGGETLVVPASVKIVANSKEGRGSWLCAPERGRLAVKGDVSCPGNRLRVFWGVSLDGELKDADKLQIDSGVAVRHPPRYEPAVLRVAAGESLQAVIDSIPEDSLRPFVVRVAPGRYREKVRVGGRRAKLSLVADDPAPGKTVVSWNDTPSTPGPNGKGLGTSGSATLTVDIPDFTMEGFTVENTGTPERLAATGGKEQAGQCVALLAKGDRNVFRNCRFLGWQDTVFAGGSVGETPARQYFENCRIEGSVDFIFGGSVALFKDCEIHSVNGGFVTAGSHAEDLPFGYVFMDCRVTCVDGKKTSLGRPWRPYANVTWIGCDFGDAVVPEGWSDWTTDCGKRVYRSAEYGCTSKGETKRPAHIEIGGKPELEDRLFAAGFRKVSDIIAGPDDWRPMRNFK